MAWVTEELIDVWESAQFVGENTPHAVVQVQLGHWVRSWRPWDGPPVSAQIWGEGNYGPADARAGHWAPVWTPTSPWYSVPNLQSVKRTKDMGQNGVTVLEVVLDAQDFVPKVGALGDSYHALIPGALAPYRNYAVTTPARPHPRWELDDDYNPADGESRLTDSVRIRVWQGYGAPQTAPDPDDGHPRTPPKDGGSNGTWTFAGMIDDVDVDGSPNIITMTARNGKLLTDQRVFRACKSVQLKDPVTFYDSLAATDVTRVSDDQGDHVIGSFSARAAYASSQQVEHPASNVLDLPANQWDVDADEYQTTWRSDRDIDDGRLEWIEIRLPQGRYDEFWIASPPGMLAYVGIYAKPLSWWGADAGTVLRQATSPPTMDGAELDEGWVDLGPRTPGAHGGWPYLRTFTTGETMGRDGIDRPSLRRTFELGDHSILRVGFTLPHGAPRPAEVGDLHGLRRKVQDDVRKQQYILVDDASEVVKVVLRWAGYQDWDVEEAGVRLSDGTNYGPGVVAKSSGRLAFNRSSYLVDIITEVAKQLGFVFFLADPKHADYPDGIPTFRRDSSLLRDAPVVASITEDTMLTGLKLKHTDESRPYIIRVRGKTATGRAGGVPLGGDSVARIMAVYLAPWAFGSRTGGVLRHIVYQDDQLITYAMCLQGCILIGLNAALAMHTAVAEIPAHPILELDDQVSVIDEPTATNSRLWIVKSEDTMTLGQQARWVQTIQGSLLDTKDLNDVLAQALGKADVMVGYGNVTHNMGRINWRHVVDPNTGKASGWRSLVIGTPDKRIVNRRR